MRKFLTILLLAFSTLACASCMNGKTSSSEQQSESSITVEMSELPETATAELGERFDIPEVTATKGGKEIAVEVSVKDSNGAEVELEGRGTRFSVTDMNGYVITFSAGEGEEQIVKTMNVQVLDTKGPEILLPASADNMTVKKGGTVSVPVATWTDKSGEATDGGYKVMFGNSEISVEKGETADTFVAEEYGEYTVVYSATDKFGNRTETSIVIECARSVLLANFDDFSKVWANEGYSEIVSEHAVEGNALKVTCNNGWQMIAVYKELLFYYKCAMMEIETKFNVLNEEFSLRFDRNPINSIKTRLKNTMSIYMKTVKLGVPFTVESVEENLHDVAGIRVTCSFVDDVYTLADALLKQDDITLITKKDYIENPKENGYRSLHLIVSVPIYLEREKREMKAEIQLRTIAMDFWASLEHQVRYKKEIVQTEETAKELYECAQASAELDARMDKLREKYEERTEKF